MELIMRYFQGHQLLELKDDLGAVRSGLEPFPRVFFVSRILMLEQCAEVRLLTVRAFFGAVLRNIAWDVLWNLRRLAWRIGFIDFDERRMGENGYHGDWRWRWWAPRVGRAPRRPTSTQTQAVTCGAEHVYLQPANTAKRLPCPRCLFSVAPVPTVAPSVYRWSVEDGSVWEPMVVNDRGAWVKVEDPKP